MYNDTIKVANKIIKSEDLFDIFSKMQEKILEYKKTSEIQERKNSILEWSDRNWDYKDEGSTLTFEVNFYDDTTIKFDNYNNFISIYYQRLEEIKRIYVFFGVSYSIKKIGNSEDYFRENINMWIFEGKADMEISLNSNYKKIDDVYELIKSKILNAPVRYDSTIKNRNKIKNTVGFTIAFIPAIIICILCLFVPAIRMMFSSTYIAFPIAVLLISYLLGTFIGSSILDGLYSNIIPEKVYAGYDDKNYQSIYKDDVEQYKQTSEILIGKNVDNLKNREKIISYYNKYKKFILPEIITLIVFSIIVLFL